jgi:hypothetical protein
VKPDDRKPARNPRRADPRTAAQVKPGRRFPPALAIALPLLVAASLMVASIRTMSATADEVAHLPAGFTYITMRDFRLNPEHPPLLKALAAIPLVIAGAHSPAPDGASWRAAAYDPDQEWQFGHDFLYATPGNDADRLLSLGRLAMIALALGLGALLWLWARDLWGEPTAAIAVLLWAFEPNLLAHGPLVTTDTGLAVFSFGACYLLWRCCREVTIGRAVAMAAFVALAAASKYSAILLAPMLAAVLAVRVVTPAPWIVQLRRRRVAFESRGRRAGVAAALLAMAGVAAYVALWGAYGFRYNATARGTALPQAARLRELAALPPTESNWQTEVAGLVLTEAAGAKLLPEAAIDGFASMLHDAQGRQSYVLGTISSTGHWWYFPLALAIKVPLPLLIFAVIGGVALARRRFGPDAENPTVWLVFAPPLVFLAIAMTSQLNLGVRHVLPVFPFLLLLAAAGAAHLWRGRGRARRVAAALLAAWLVVGTLRAFPHFLAYFNEIAGRAQDRVHWLADSNLDWGQDLPGLRDWMRVHDVRRINLCYFGNADPTHYGIDFVGLPGSWGVWDQRRPSQPEVPGYLAISATNLAGVGLQTPRLRSYYASLLERASLVDVIGSSIFIYYLPAG